MNEKIVLILFLMIMNIFFVIGVIINDNDVCSSVIRCLICFAIGFLLAKLVEYFIKKKKGK